MNATNEEVEHWNPSPLTLEHCTRARWVLLGRLFAAGLPATVSLSIVPDPRDVIEASGLILNGRLVSATETTGGEPVYLIEREDPQTHPQSSGELRLWTNLREGLAAVGIALGPVLAHLEIAA